MVDELRFFGKHVPGLIGMSPKDQKSVLSKLKKTRPELVSNLEDERARFDLLRDAISCGPYPGIGGGGRAADLALVFAWRNWQTLRMNGQVGIVLPRTILSSTVAAEWRIETIAKGTLSAVTVTNAGQWVFESVDGRYSIALISLHKHSESVSGVVSSGPFFDKASFEAGRDSGCHLRLDTLRKASEGLAIPQLSDAQSSSVFEKLLESPTIANSVMGVVIKPVYEFNATTDRPVFDSNGTSGAQWPVIGGAGFDLWTPDTGDVYAWANPRRAIEALQERRLRQVRTKSSAFYGADATWSSDPSTLPCNHARIAFRDITNSTNTRTCIVALVPPSVFLTNKAPYLLFPPGTEKVQAFLLGVLSSIPLDWYARRFVELTMNFQILNGLPVPACDIRETRVMKLVENSARLAAVDERYEVWAKAVGVETGSVSEREKDLVIAENDALVAHLYGLSRQQVEHMFKTFQRGWDFTSRLQNVLKSYEALPEVGD
jgi:hypothetical protein